MCGLAGVVHAPILESVQALACTQKMIEVMRNRGPDSQNEWVGPGVVLGHCRLSVQDLNQRSNQPFVASSGRFIMVYNGEVYNFKELKEELNAKGVQLHTSSDTEVLIKFFEIEGAECLNRFRGMFSFAIWDNWRKELFMVRDPYGIKPLYYSTPSSGVFIFSSQVKSLLASRMIDMLEDPAGLVGFYLTGSVPEPHTIYEGIKALPAGYSMRVKDGVIHSFNKWADIRNNWYNASNKYSDVGAVVSNGLKETIKYHFVSDVPIVVFLSGGVDSAVLLAIAKESGCDVEALTIAFHEFDNKKMDELPRAKKLANFYGVKHHTRIVTKSEFLEDLPNLMAAMDQPTVDGINTWYASKAAKELGFKVAMTGVGADELFAGYPSFNFVSRMNCISNFFGKKGLDALDRALSVFDKIFGDNKLFKVAKYMGTLEGLYFIKRAIYLPHEIQDIVGVDTFNDGMTKLKKVFFENLDQKNKVSNTAAVSVLESSLYLKNQLLRDSDWASMAHSIELRTPFVDAFFSAKIAPYASFFKGNNGKNYLANVPINPLPKFILKTKKTGFMTPLNEWTSGKDNPDLFGFNDNTKWIKNWVSFVLKEYKK